MKSTIFVVSLFLLVPFVYGYSFVSDVCAERAEDGFLQSKDCRGDLFDQEVGQTCCWTEKDAKGKEVKYCQTCSAGEKELFCGPPVSGSSRANILKDLETLPKFLPNQSGLSQGNVLKDPSTLPKLNADQNPGIVGQPQENNSTLSPNISSSNDRSIIPTLEEEQVENQITDDNEQTD